MTTKQKTDIANLFEDLKTCPLGEESLKLLEEINRLLGEIEPSDSKSIDRNISESQREDFHCGAFDSQEERAYYYANN